MKKQDAEKAFLPNEEKNREVILGKSETISKEDEKKQVTEMLSQVEEGAKKDKLQTLR